MYYLHNMFELPPIDEWSKSLSLKKVFGMYADQVKSITESRVYNHCHEKPHTIRCGIYGNPNGQNFEPIVYAKISNNGTVYAFTDALLGGYQRISERHEPIPYLYDDDYDDIPF